MNYLIINHTSTYSFNRLRKIMINETIKVNSLTLNKGL